MPWVKTYVDDATNEKVEWYQDQMDLNKVDAVGDLVKMGAKTVCDTDE